MGERYLRVAYDALFASEGWKKLSPGEQAEALRRLFASIQEGRGLPESWKRVASLRSVGDKPVSKPKKFVPERYQPFKDVWDKLWLEARGFSYVWDGKQKAGLYRAHQKANGELTPFEARTRKLLSGQKDHWMIDNASPCLLDSKWNELGTGLNGGPKVCSKCGRGGVELLDSSRGKICYRCWK